MGVADAIQPTAHPPPVAGQDWLAISAPPACVAKTLSVGDTDIQPALVMGAMLQSRMLGACAGMRRSAQWSVAACRFCQERLDTMRRGDHEIYTPRQSGASRWCDWATISKNVCTMDHVRPSDHPNAGNDIRWQRSVVAPAPARDHRALPKRGVTGTTACRSSPRLRRCQVHSRRV